MSNVSSRMLVRWRSMRRRSDFFVSPFSCSPLMMRSASSCSSCMRFSCGASCFSMHSLKRPLFTSSMQKNSVFSLHTCVGGVPLFSSSLVVRHSSRSFMVSPRLCAPTPRLNFAFLNALAKKESTGIPKEEEGKKRMGEGEKGEEQGRSPRRPPTLPSSGASSLLDSTSASLPSSSSSSSFLPRRWKKWARRMGLFTNAQVSSSSSSSNSDSFSSSLPFLQEDAESYSNENSSQTNIKNRRHVCSQGFGGYSGESGSPLSFSSSRARESVVARQMQTEELQALCRLTNGKPIPSVLRVTCRTTPDKHLEWIDITCVNAGNTSSMEWGKGLKEYLSVLGVPSGEAMTSSNYFSFPHASVLDGCQCAFTRTAARQSPGEAIHSLQSLTDRLALFILEIPSQEEVLQKNTTGLHSESPHAAPSPASPVSTKDATAPPKSVRSPAHRRRRKMTIARQRRWTALRAASSLLFTSFPAEVSDHDRVPSKEMPALSSSSPPTRHGVRSERLGRKRRRSSPQRVPDPYSESMWREAYAETSQRKRGKGMPHPVPTTSPLPTNSRTMQTKSTRKKNCDYCHHMPFFDSPLLQADENARAAFPAGALSRILKRKLRKKPKRRKEKATDPSSSSSNTPKRTLFISAHRMPLFCVHELHLDWEKKCKESELLSKLLYFFMKRILGSYLHNLVKCMVEFDGLETSVLRSDMDKEVLTRKMYDIKRRVAVYERCLSLTQETYAHVVAALPTVDKDNRFYELQHRMANAEGLAKDLCSDAESALELLFQYSSYEVNELMRFLTLFSAFFIPLNFLTSIYGMNFEGLPLVDSAHGGWCLTVVFLLAIGGLLTVFKRRKFL